MEIGKIETAQIKCSAIRAKIKIEKPLSGEYALLFKSNKLVINPGEILKVKHVDIPDNPQITGDYFTINGIPIYNAKDLINSSNFRYEYEIINEE